MDVIKLSKQKLDQQLRNEIFESMKVEINIIHQDMEECRERIQTIEDTHIPPNIRRKCDIVISKTKLNGVQILEPLLTIHFSYI